MTLIACCNLWLATCMHAWESMHMISKWTDEQIRSLYHVHAQSVFLLKCGRVIRCPELIITVSHRLNDWSITTGHHPFIVANGQWTLTMIPT